MKTSRRIMYWAAMLLLAFVMASCVAQRKHHKAVPCPCEKQNRR